MTTPHDVPKDELEDALWQGAKGLYPAEAAVLLLTHHDHWLHSRSLRHYMVLSDSRATPGIDRRMAWVKWAEVLAELDGGDRDTPEETWIGGSGSEIRMLRLCCSLGDADCKVALEDAVSGMGEGNVRLVMSAIGHASRGFDNPTPLPWPVRP